MDDPIRVGDVLTGDPDREQRARVRLDQRLESLAAIDEQAARRGIEFAQWVTSVLPRHPALAGWVACGYVSSVIRRVRGRTAPVPDPRSPVQDI